MIGPNVRSISEMGDGVRIIAAAGNKLDDFDRRVINCRRVKRHRLRGDKLMQRLKEAAEKQIDFPV